jgi:protease-4
MPPSAILQLDGLTESVIYLRGAFDKLGISPNYAQAGEFKSAVETYTRVGMSPAARRALDALLDDEYRILVDSLANTRGLTAEAVRHLLDAGPYVAKEALAQGLVDTLLYDAEVDSLAFRSVAGRGLTALSFTRYLESLSPERDGPHVALIDAAGTIMPGKSRFIPSEGRALGSETLIEALRQARQRRSIKAVVLRVDSPGGSLQASDDIWREMEMCRQTKPLIVSMSDLAASGGYYIALPADRIVAQPSTLTGSIGVYGGKLNILGLFHKLGINVETLSRGAHAEMFSPFHDFSRDEAERFQHQLDEGYRLFLSRVAAARRLSTAATDSVSQGRVWSGAAARRLGLVDSLGGMEVAFGIALERAGYKSAAKFAVDRLPKVEHPFFEGLLEDWLSDDGRNGNEDSRSVAGLRLSIVLEAWQAAAQFPVGVPLALTPYQIVIR